MHTFGQAEVKEGFVTENKLTTLKLGSWTWCSKHPIPKWPEQEPNKQNLQRLEEPWQKITAGLLTLLNLSCIFKLQLWNRATAWRETQAGAQPGKGCKVILSPTASLHSLHNAVSQFSSASPSVHSQAGQSGVWNVWSIFIPIFSAVHMVMQSSVSCLQMCHTHLLWHCTRRNEKCQCKQHCETWLWQMPLEVPSVFSSDLEVLWLPGSMLKNWYDWVIAMSETLSLSRMPSKFI